MRTWRILGHELWNLISELRAAGFTAEAYVGSDIRGLIAPGDQFALEAGLKTLNEYGRLAPMTIRLADRQRTAVALAGLVMAGGSPATLMVTAALAAAPMVLMARAVTVCLPLPSRLVFRL